MARIVLTDAFCSINGVDLSDHIANVTLSTTDDVIDTTGFSSTSAAGRTRVAGLSDNSVTLEFHQDFATSSVEQTIYPLLGTTTTVVVKPTSAIVSANNPSLTFTALVSEWQPLSGAVGELSTASITWPISGTITKGV
jgi:hypothetical protein